MKRPSPSSAIPAAAVPKKFRSGPPPATASPYTQHSQHHQHQQQPQQQGHYNPQQPNQYQAYTQNYQFQPQAHSQPSQPQPYAGAGNYYDQSQAYYAAGNGGNNNGSYYSNASGYQMSSSSASSGYGQPQSQGYSNHGGNGAQMYGSAGPSTAGQQSQQGYATGSTPTGNRTIFFGNVINGITLDQLLDHITSGPLESARILPDKSCAFVTFIYPNDANTFLTSYPSHTLTIGQTLVNLNWGKKDQDPLSPSLQSAVGAGATRNVYITGIQPATPVAEIYADMEPFGVLDQVRVIPPRGEHTMAIGFVHFASIHSAISCVQTLASVNPKYYGRKVAYGKDRCAPGGANSMGQRSGPRGGALNGPSAGGMPQQQQQQAYSDGYAGAGYGAPSSSSAPMAPLGAPASAAAAMYSTIWPEDPTLNVTNNLSYMCSGPGSPLDTHVKVNPTGSARTLYFGNLPEDVIPEDVCNVVRAGLIERVHMHHRDNKRFVFVTFIDPRAASLMFYLAETYGVVIRGRKARVSWGKHTGPVQQNVAQAVVSSGATRCVYVGGLAPFCRSLIQAYGGQPEGSDVVMSEAPAAADASGNGDTSTSTSPSAHAPSSTNASTGTPANLISVLAAQLREELRAFGDVEVIYAPADKPIAFVHFMDVRAAIRAVAEATPMLRQRLNASNLRIGYARDRCADPVKVPASAGQPIGGTIPRRVTGSYHPAEGLRTGASTAGGQHAGYANQYAASGAEAGAAVQSTGAGGGGSGTAGQGAASLPRKPMLNIGLRHGHGGASAVILGSDSSTLSAAAAAAAASTASDVGGYVDTGDDDPAAGVRDEMLDDMVEH